MPWGGARHKCQTGFTIFFKKIKNMNPLMGTSYRLRAAPPWAHSVSLTPGVAGPRVGGGARPGRRMQGPPWGSPFQQLGPREGRIPRGHPIVTPLSYKLRWPTAAQGTQNHGEDGPKGRSLWL